MSENFLGPWADKWQDRKSKRTRQKNKRWDEKEELNDGPEIQDRGWCIRLPRPPWGWGGGGRQVVILTVCARLHLFSTCTVYTQISHSQRPFSSLSLFNFKLSTFTLLSVWSPSCTLMMWGAACLPVSEASRCTSSVLPQPTGPWISAGRPADTARARLRRLSIMDGTPTQWCWKHTSGQSFTYLTKYT